MKIGASLPHLPPFPSDLSKEALLQALKEGDLLQGRVVRRLDDETWLIRTAGRDIVARSSATLVEGQAITARVDALGPPVFLTLLESGVTTDPEEAVARMLTQGGIRDDPLNRAIVLRMMESGLQITGTEVEAVRQTLIRLKISDKTRLQEAIDQILLLRARSAPVNAETMILTPHGNEGLLFGRTIDQLLRDLAAFASGDTEIADLLNRMIRLFISSDEITEESIRCGLRDGGLSLEVKLTVLLLAANDQADLRDDLKGLLFALRAMLESRLAGTISEGEHHRVVSLLNRLDEALNLIKTLQITNLPQKTSDPSSYIYIYLPLEDGDHWKSVGIRIGYREEDGRRVIDPEQTTITVELDMAALGRVDVGLSVNGQTIDGRIRTEDTEKMAFLEEEGAELRQGLERIGYRLRNLTVGLLSQEKGEEISRSKVGGIDVRI